MTDLIALGALAPPSNARAAPSPPARRLAASLRELTSSRGVDETLQLVVDLATELVAACDLGDVMLLGPGGVTTCVGTHPLATELGRIQEETGEGPCLQATLDEEPIIGVADLATDDRWSSFGPRAATAGVRSMVSYGLYLGRGRTSRLGAMNLYSHRVGAFDPVSIQLGGVLATECATAVATAIDRDGMCRALDARALIGHAKSLVMDRYLVDASRAFARLQTSSNEHGLTVGDVARHVTSTGELPGGFDRFG